MYSNLVLKAKEVENSIEGWIWVPGRAQKSNLDLSGDDPHYPI